MTHLLTAIVLAAPQPGDYDPSTGKGPEWGKAAPIGLLVILLLAIALFFLLRSFTRQLKKVPASFDPPDTDPPDTDAPVNQTPDASGPTARVPAAPRVDVDAGPPGATDGGPTGGGPTGRTAPSG